jgi:hypothetical protein
MASRKIDYYLQGTARLQQLTEHANHLINLQKLYIKLAPSGLAVQSSVAAHDGRTLVITTGNGAIAAKLRQQLPSLLAKFQERGVEVTSIQVRVQARNPEPTPGHPKQIALSSAALSDLERLSKSLEDAPLKMAVETMIARHKTGKS